MKSVSILNVGCFLLIGITASACVTSGTYDALQTQHNALKADDEKLQAEHAALKAREADTQGKLKACDQAKADTEAALQKEQATAKGLAERVAKLEADLAGMLKDRKVLQASVADMKTALAELQKRKAEADQRIADFKSLLQKFRSLIDAGKLRVKIAEGRMVVELATDVLFASGSANLSKEGKAAIAEVAGLLVSIQEKKFQIEGHTDNVPIATAQYPSNWELAAARALTVLRAMLDSGMPPARISAASFGESKPAKTNDTPENRAANRRIEIVVVPDLSALPGFEELNRAAGGS